MPCPLWNFFFSYVSINFVENYRWHALLTHFHKIVVRHPLSHIFISKPMTWTHRKMTTPILLGHADDWRTIKMQLNASTYCLLSFLYVNCSSIVSWINSNWYTPINSPYNVFLCNEQTLPALGVIIQECWKRICWNRHSTQLQV